MIAWQFRKLLKPAAALLIAFAGPVSLVGCTSWRQPASPPTTAAAPRTNTLQPFAAGDLLIVGSFMGDKQDDHLAVGRILQYDRNLVYKGQLWLTGTTHMIVGLDLDAQNTLWAFDPINSVIVQIGPDGRQKPPLPDISPRSFSNVLFLPNGNLLFGEHFMGKETSSDVVSTRFHLLPGKDVIGDGHVFEYDADLNPVREIETASEGGYARFLGTTSMALADNSNRLIYLSETGKQIRQYDLAGGRQLPPLLDVAGEDDIPRLIVLTQGQDDLVLISSLTGFFSVSTTTGKIVRKYPLADYGWSAIRQAQDADYAFAGNIVTGELAKIDLRTGETLKSVSIGISRSLTSIVEVPALSR
jgi:hypothetical protein